MLYCKNVLRNTCLAVEGTVNEKQLDEQIISARITHQWFSEIEEERFYVFLGNTGNNLSLSPLPRLQ